ncbi:MAG: DEAD/DEAH box helicase [Verrucomicrobiia bacterium]
MQKAAPGGFALRPYQVEAVRCIQEGFVEFRKQLLVLPTGAGKTITFAFLAEKQMPRRTLILAHREELIEQAVEKIRAATGLIAQVEKAERRASLQAHVVVASVQTMQRRLDKWPKDHFALVVADEAHHAISDSWQEVLNHFDGHANILGVTATPHRGDKRNLGKYFENIAYEVSLLDLVKDQYLCPIVIQSVPLKIDISQVKQQAGDFDATQLDDALAPYLGEIANQIKVMAHDRKTLVFLPLIKTSQRFAEVARAAGLNADHVDGAMDGRSEMIEKFHRGDVQVLSNAMLLTEGFDCPDISCLVMLRPTRSQPLYAQAVGRGTRIAEGKKNLLLLDFLWLHERHTLIRPAHLIARNDEEAKIMTELAEKKGGGGEQSDLLELQGSAVQEREDRLAAEIKKMERRRAKTIMLQEFAVMMHQPELADFEPEASWHEQPMTDKQREVLTKFGFPADDVKNRGHASALLDAAFRRRDAKLATPKQMFWMKRFGYKSPEIATFEQATVFLNRRFGNRRKAA